LAHDGRSETSFPDAEPTQHPSRRCAQSVSTDNPKITLNPYSRQENDQGRHLGAGQEINSTRALLWNLSDSVPPAGKDAYWDLYIQFDSAHTLDASVLDEVVWVHGSPFRSRRSLDGVFAGDGHLRLSLVTLARDGCGAGSHPRECECSPVVTVSDG
jgi:hypothetical protein